MCPKGGVVIGQFQSSRGSGTVLALGAVAMSITLFGLSQLVAFNLLQHARVQSTANAMAIAAADALRGLNSGFPCQTAHEIAHINGVNLDTCRIVGFEVFISAHSKGVGVVLSANALAGPSY